MEEGKGEMLWEHSIEKCILPYVKWMTSASSLHDAGHSKPVLWDGPEGWDGKGGGKGVQDGGTHLYMWLIHVDVCKNHHIVKQLKLIKFKIQLN